MEKKYRLIPFLIFCCGMFCSYAQTIVKMEQSGGVYKIPCKVNGLSLKFIFDTGASDISISLTEALFMLKNDYLSEKDFMGTEYYRIANGDIQEGTKVNLRVIEVGGQKIYNVQASITHTTDAPILFGQSALQRFGKISVDYSTNTLILGSNSATNITQPQSKGGKKICKDIEGNVYKTVRIGYQYWMSENLKVSHYNNGDTINESKSHEEEDNCDKAGIGCWEYLDYKSLNGTYYGELYNWYAVIDPRQLCPTGWHTPSDEEWTELSNYLGGDSVSGGHMKAISDLWIAPNIRADNSSGFTALPAGSSSTSYYIDVLGIDCFFWSSTQNENLSAWSRRLDNNSSVLTRYGNELKKNEYSVRCVGD